MSLDNKHSFRSLVSFLIAILTLYSLQIASSHASAAGASISGSVLDQNGNPISGAEVLSHDGSIFRTTLSIANGSYSLTDVPAGDQHLQAKLSGSNLAYAHYWNFHVLDGGAYSNKDFNLRIGGGTVSGRVVDGAGDGVAEAIINVFEQTDMGYDNGAWATTTADLNGYFATSATDAPGPGLPSGIYTVKASRSAMPDALIYNVPVSSGSNTEVQLTIVSGSSSISGTITSVGTGNPIEGAEVVADNGIVQVTTYTTSDGSYILEHLPAGGYNVVVRKLGYASAHRYGVQTQDGSPATGVDFALTQQMGQISGLVVDQNGIAIVGANSLADSDQGSGFGSTTTNGSGEYMLTNLAPMEYHVHATAPGYGGLMRVEVVEDGKTTSEVNFVLGEATGGISGRVTKDGQPAAYASVFTNSSAGSSNVYYGSTTTDSSGYYNLGNLPAGDYDVHVYDVPGYTNQVRFNISVGTSPTTDIDFDLSNGTSIIAGNVTDASTGDPIEDVKVQVFLTESPGTWGTDYSDSLGDYSISNLWSGLYMIAADKVGYDKVTITNIFVPAQSTTQIDIVMGETPALIVRPDTVFVMVEDVFGTYRHVQTDVTSGGPVSWVAETAASWLYLGPSGGVHQTTGQSGETLMLRFDPAVVPIGTYQTTVTMTSNDAAAISIQVEMLKVAELHKLYLPLVQKTNP